MMKVIKVKICWDCPYSKVIFNKPEKDKIGYLICKHITSNRNIDNPDYIPSWCPLENYKEEKNDERSKQFIDN